VIQLGDIKIHLINAGNVLVDGGGAFGLVPRALWKHILAPDDDNMVPMSLTCLLVQTGGKNIIIDTGLGDRLGERGEKIWHLDMSSGGLRGGLARLGLSPADIHLVIDTHLHADHASGNMVFGENKDLLPAFPNAEYVVQRREYDDAMHPNERTRATYIPENYQPLVESGQMRLLEGDTELASGVWGVITSGHTPGHMSVRMESGGQHALFTCDMSSYAVHFERLGWMTAYDVEPLVTLETKRKWQGWAVETNALLIFPHETKHPVGRLVVDGKVKKIVPVDEPYV
jgi:glyoxylase-like metal-dependent hydrolase (beta-lactamase superfamily II)